MADVVGKNDVELRDVERLSRPKQHIRKDRVQQGMSISARAVEQQDHVIGVAGSIAMWLTEGEVVQFQLRDRFAAAEVEIPDDIVAVLGWPVAGLSMRGRDRKQGGEEADRRCESSHASRGSLPFEPEACS